MKGSNSTVWTSRALIALVRGRRREASQIGRDRDITQRERERERKREKESKRDRKRNRGR